MAYLHGSYVYVCVCVTYAYESRPFLQLSGYMRILICTHVTYVSMSHMHMYISKTCIYVYMYVGAIYTIFIYMCDI